MRLIHWIILGISLALGMAIGELFPSVAQSLLRPLSLISVAYVTPDNALYDAYERASPPQPLSWEELLPDTERKVLKKYQQQEAISVDSLTNQILSSISASSDNAYQAALQSTQTVASFTGKWVSLSGFVVPIDYHDDKSPSLVFLVPYYGACIHFPPPPPNQIVFTRLDKGFSTLNMNHAYTFTGVIEQGLFEDPMGTSAYQLRTVKIERFYGNPDDFRTH